MRWDGPDRAASSSSLVLQYERRGRHIFNRNTHRLEQRNLLFVAPAGIHPGHYGADLCHLALCRDDVARFTQCGFARIDEDTSCGHEIIVKLAPVGASGADRIDVSPGGKPAS